jgi:hypothetical protein
MNRALGLVAGAALVCSLAAGQGLAGEKFDPNLMGRAHGLVSTQVNGKEVPCPAGMALYFHNKGTHKVYPVKTVVVEAANPKFEPPVAPDTVEWVADRRRPSNYWTGIIPSGTYKVKIRHPDFLPYNDPRNLEIPPATPQKRSVRIDFAGLRRRHFGGTDAAGEPAGGPAAGEATGDVESPLAGGPAAAGEQPGGAGQAGMGEEWAAAFIDPWEKEPPASVPADTKFKVTVSWKNTGTKTWHINVWNDPQVVRPKQIGSPNWNIFIVPVAETWIRPGAIGHWTIDVWSKIKGNKMPLKFRLYHGKTPFGDASTTRFVTVY